MPIPDFYEGLLPPGVHECSIDEVRARFGTFQGSDRRPRLFEKLEQYLTEARKTGLVLGVIIDGSFVTAAANPNDIDLLIELRHDHNFSLDLRPVEYNVLSGVRVRRRYQMDVFAAVEGSPLSAQYLDFFTQVRGDRTRRKGLLRVTLLEEGA